MNNFQISKVNLRGLLGIWLVFCQFQPGVAHKSVVFNRKKACTCAVEPPLPKECASKDHVFSYTGVDYAGPIYVKNGSDFNIHKEVHIIVTRPSSRVLYLDFVENCLSASYVNMLKQFINQYGAPKQVSSGNGCKFASKAVKEFIP